MPEINTSDITRNLILTCFWKLLKSGCDAVPRITGLLFSVVDLIDWAKQIEEERRFRAIALM